VQVGATSADDIVFYWYCTGAAPQSDCDGLEKPCSRAHDECGDSALKSETEAEVNDTMSSSTVVAVIVAVVLSVCFVGVLTVAFMYHKRRNKDSQTAHNELVAITNMNDNAETNHDDQNSAIKQVEDDSNDEFDV